MTNPGTIPDLRARFGRMGCLFFATGWLVWTLAGAVLLARYVINPFLAWLIP